MMSCINFLTLAIAVTVITSTESFRLRGRRDFSDPCDGPGNTATPGAIGDGTSPSGTQRERENEEINDYPRRGRNGWRSPFGDEDGERRGPPRWGHHHPAPPLFHGHRGGRRKCRPSNTTGSTPPPTTTPPLGSTSPGPTEQPPAANPPGNSPGQGGSGPGGPIDNGPRGGTRVNTPAPAGGPGTVERLSNAVDA